jgi:16S rRNA G966 N2-methylase RsmD
MLSLSCDLKDSDMVNRNITSTMISYKSILEHVNPDFTIKKINHPDGFKLNLIDEGMLIGGSKQRIMPMLLSTIPQNTIVYAGPSTGYAQIALAYVCRMMNKKAVLFLDCTEHDKSPLTNIAKIFGAKVYYFNPRIQEKRLRYITNRAKKWCNANKDSYMLPFGMSDGYTMELYMKVFNKLEINPGRIWVVAGSGLIFTSLSKVFPNTKMMIIQVGKTIWPDQLEGINHELFISSYKFKEDTKQEPPYDTLLNYDAKVWDFIIKYGKENDYIWNTASSPKPFSIYRSELTDITKLKKEYTINTKKPEHALSMGTKEEMFNKLCKTANNWKPTSKVHRNLTNVYYILDGISNHFSENVRMHCVVNRNLKISPYTFINSNFNKIIKHTTFLYSGYSMTDNKKLLNTVGDMYGYRECNTFNPFIIINFIKNYSKNIEGCDILDPSMGWGDRLLACLSLGVKSYTGFDPNTHLHSCYNDIVKTTNTSTNTTFIESKFSMKDINKKYDIVFTSPPFFNIELYHGTEKDISKGYANWMNTIYVPYLKDMITAVKNGGYVGIYIDNLFNEKIADETNKILSERLVFVERLVFQNDYYDFNGILHDGKYRSTWVYKKTLLYT